MRSLPPILLSLVVGLVGCQDEPTTSDEVLDFPVDGEGGKFDVFGRSLAGVAAPYEPDRSLAFSEERLNSEMGFRRQVAWQIIGRTLDPVPLLGLAQQAEMNEEIMLPEGEVPRVPRFQTWYGVDDFRRMFKELYESLGEQGRARRDEFSEEALGMIFEWNAAAIERSSRWPLERYLRYVTQIGTCPDGTPEEDCANTVQSNFSGASSGNIRITYSPGTILHLLENYPRILACLDELDSLALDAEPSDGNFSFCFNREFPDDAVLIKAQWARAGFGFELKTYDTDAETLTARLAPESSADWVTEDRLTDPGPDNIYSIRLRSGAVFRLVGFHIMTKETRHWTWITMWWSDQPNTDFGADRPDFIRENLDPVFSNYKMCIVTDYLEGDSDVGQWFQDEAPDLAAALRASGSMGAPSWCSNPYVEEGRGNARTNCIGCHQHGGSSVGHDLDDDGTPDEFDLNAVIANETQFPFNGRTQIREVFPADYTWQLNRVDALATVIRREVEFFDFSERETVPGRARRLLELDGVVADGMTTFSENCARCHGDDGTGTSMAPSLFDRVPMRDDFSVAETIIGGRGLMPTWGDDFDDQTIRNLVAYLRATFDGGT